MIAVDTSALIAILRREPEATILMQVMATAERILVGMPTLLEFNMVATGSFGSGVSSRAATLLLPPRTERVIFDEQHLDAAIAAFDRYGKSRHAAALNYGDCMAYAVAKVAGCALLYKGNDFARTDIRSAL